MKSRKGNLVVTIKSFSFKKRIPKDDSGHGGGFIFDCRALQNPGRELRFKFRNGRHLDVKRYIEAQPGAKFFFKHVCALVNQAITTYLKRDFTSLSVYFGCTGGQHRSVYFAEKLAKTLAKRKGVKVKLCHDCLGRKR